MKTKPTLTQTQTITSVPAPTPPTPPAAKPITPEPEPTLTKSIGLTRTTAGWVVVYTETEGEAVTKAEVWEGPLSSKAQAFEAIKLGLLRRLLREFV